MILYITDRNIRVDNADNQISYNSDYIAEFHFDDEWNGKIKTARFVQNGEYVDVVLVDDRCDIPPLKTGFVRVGVFSDSMTSTYADVYYKTSIKDGTGNPTEPPEDVYAQLTALIESGMLKGADGLTPYVGEKGNWWIGDVDTGVLARGYTPQKGVDYFTTEEVQQIQNEVSESIQANINYLEINKADKSELDKTNLSLDALWKMNRGQTYDVLEQESEAYSVDVPSGSHYASVDMVGGKSLVFAQLCRFSVGASFRAFGVTLTAKDETTIILNGTCTISDWTYGITQLLKGGFAPLKEKNLLAIGGNNGIAFSVIQGVGIRTSFTEGVTYSNYEISLNLIDRDKIGLTDEEIKAVLSLPIPYNEGEIISSQNDRVDVASADGTITQQIETGFPVLNSAGSVYDYIDIDNGKLHQRVGVVDLGTLDWEYSTVDTIPKFSSLGISGAIKKVESYTSVGKFICTKYAASDWITAFGAGTYNLLATNPTGVIAVGDSDYTDATAFKAAMSGVMLYYELAEPIITDIDIPTELTEWLEVESGGSITFHNSDEGKRFAIPNKETFIRKLDEVTV